MSERHMLTRVDDIQKFILAGNATITLVSKKTSQRFTYKIKRAVDDNGAPRDFWFVSVLRGPDNEEDYSYLGYINNKLHYWYGLKSKIHADSGSSKGFEWFYTLLKDADNNNMDYRDALFAGLEVWHEGKCGRCGRKLTVPTSILSGFGPECINYV